VLTALGSEPRLAADEELKILVVAHSKVPAAVAERLAASLTTPALRRALSKPSLTAAARSAIQKRLVLGGSAR
jgi:hypothetical protein